MFQYDPEKSRHVSSAPSIDKLRALLRRHVRDGASSAPDDAWRLAARLMSADAHDRALRVEELLISIKRAWPTLADAERVPRLDSTRLLARLVTLCVEEYYAPLGRAPAERRVTNS